MNESGKFKAKKVYFSQVSNYAIRDNKLSLKAKGLYSLIQSYITIENFVLYKTTLRKQCSEGRDSFDKAWKELKTKGYLIQERHSKGDGTFIYEYDLLDIVHTLENQYTDNPVDGKGGIYTNTDLTNTDLKNTERYVILPNDDSFLNLYCYYFKIIKGKDHIKVKESKLEEVMEWINDLRSKDIDEEYFREGVIDHFNNLPEGNSGNIITFMESSQRHYEVRSPKQLRESVY